MIRNHEVRKGKTVSEKIDFWLTHKILGFPFSLHFSGSCSNPLLYWANIRNIGVNLGVSGLGSLIGSLMPGGPLKDLLVDGIINGVGSIIVFLPNILILSFHFLDGRYRVYGQGGIHHG